MKILCFHLVRELPEPTVVEKTVEVPVIGPALMVKAWEVDVGLEPGYSGLSYFRRRHEYFPDCVQANKSLPGRSGRQVELLQVGGRFFRITDALKEVYIAKRQPARKKKS